MAEKSDFLEIARRFVDENEFVLVNELKTHFSDRSRSYVHVCLNSLKKRGLVERLDRNVWRLIEPTSEEVLETTPSIKVVEAEVAEVRPLRPLVLTPEERVVFDLLTEVKTKCTDKNNGPRFVEDEVQVILQSKKLALTEWISLKEKLCSLGIICPKGKGLKGFIYELNEDLLLDYLTGEHLVKETLWREEKVRANLQSAASQFKQRASEIFSLQEEIQQQEKVVSDIRLEVSKAEERLLNLKRRLDHDFPDRDKVLAFQELLSSMEHLGEEDALQFIKSVLGA